jgi:predicted transcriptional regulator
MSSPTTVKRSAQEVIDALSDTASWSDLMYALELRADIEAGIADADAGRVYETDDIRREFGLLK